MFANEGVDLVIGQTYIVDGERMELYSIYDRFYKFIKGDKSVVVPEKKLDQFVIEKENNKKDFPIWIKDNLEF